MNVVSSINLLQAMALHGVYRLLFSSSSKVYGTPRYLPLDEGHPTGNCTSPYGTTKYMVEEILSDVSQADTRWCIRVLRYFNPCGAHSSGKLGETVIGPPQNLMPRVCYAAQGRLDGMAIYGSDYETPDGTAVKDYTHVVDLARGHIAAIRSLQGPPGYRVYNMSRGVTHSILDMVKMFEQISGTKIQVELHGRKAGELGEVFSDPGRAASELGWRAERSLQTMCTYVREQACAVGPF